MSAQIRVTPTPPFTTTEIPTRWLGVAWSERHLVACDARYVHDDGMKTALHNVSIEVQKESFSTFGQATAQVIVLGYDVRCSCGWQGWYRTLPEANEACGLHCQGLDPTPTPPEEVERQVEERRRVTAEEFERIRKRMIETGDPFAE